MFDTARARILVVVVLLSAQAALVPLYATQPVNPEMGVFPTEEDFVWSEEVYIDEEVTTAGVVQSTEPLVVRGRTGERSYRVVVTDSGSSAGVGDTVWVFGVLNKPHNINPIDVHTIPRSGYWYSLSISFVAGLWVLFRLSRHWRFDTDTLSVQPREDSHFLESIAESSRRGDGERDA